MVQLVSPPVWNPPPTVPASVSVAASANQGLSSRDDAVCHWRNVVAWMTRTITLRSDVIVQIPCKEILLVQEYTGHAMGEMTMRLSIVVVRTYSDL